MPNSWDRGDHVLVSVRVKSCSRVDVHHILLFPACNPALSKLFSSSLVLSPVKMDSFSSYIHVFYPIFSYINSSVQSYAYIIQSLIRSLVSQVKFALVLYVLITSYFSLLAKHSAMSGLDAREAAIVAREEAVAKREEEVEAREAAVALREQSTTSQSEEDAEPVPEEPTESKCLIDSTTVPPTVQSEDFAVEKEGSSTEQIDETTCDVESSSGTGIPQIDGIEKVSTTNEEESTQALSESTNKQDDAGSSLEDDKLEPKIENPESVPSTLHDMEEPRTVDDHKNTMEASKTVNEDCTLDATEAVDESKEEPPPPVEDNMSAVDDTAEATEEDPVQKEEITPKKENAEKHSEKPVDEQSDTVEEASQRTEEQDQPPVDSEEKKEVSTPVNLEETQNRTPAPTEVDDIKRKIEHLPDSEELRDNSTAPEKVEEEKDDFAAEVKAEIEKSEDTDILSHNNPEKSKEDVGTPIEESVLVESDKSPEEHESLAPIENSVQVESTSPDPEISTSTEPEATGLQVESESPAHEINKDQESAPLNEVYVATQPQPVITEKSTGQVPETILNTEPAPAIEEQTELNEQREIPVVLPVHPPPITA
jgi:hypothetical protein